MREYTEEWRSINQRLTRLEYDTRQPRLAMEAYRPANTKTRERTEGAAKAVQAKHGGSCTAQRVQDEPKISTCFGVLAEPPALPCRDDVVVENGTAPPKSCLDALTNRRWWLPCHRRSLYSDDDRLQPATSSALLDRGDGFKEDEFEDSDSIRLVRQQFLACFPLLPEGHRDKIRRK